MFGMHRTRRDRATVAGPESFRLAATGQRDLAADHHDARVPIVGVVGVHVIGAQAAVENLVALTPKIGLEFALVHHKGLRLLRVTPLPPAPVGTRSYRRR